MAGPMRTVLLATLSLFLFQSCFHRAGEITLVSQSEPLIVELDPGTELIDWVWFQGPHRNLLEDGPEPPLRQDPKDVIVWQISPKMSNQAQEFEDKHPIITYGQVPPRWVQLLPATGSPSGSSPRFCLSCILTRSGRRTDDSPPQSLPLSRR